MPLLDIVGVTATGATFFVGFGFIQMSPMISSREAWNLYTSRLAFYHPRQL